MLRADRDMRQEISNTVTFSHDVVNYWGEDIAGQVEACRSLCLRVVDFRLKGGVRACNLPICSNQKRSVCYDDETVQQWFEEFETLKSRVFV